MRPYTKAYYLKQLRQFSGWKEVPRSDAAELNDDTVVFIQDNFTVVRDPFNEEDFLMKDATPEWIAFCENTLEPKFAIPDDLKFLYEEEVAVTAETGANP
jgi:hypothetical protein